MSGYEYEDETEKVTWSIVNDIKQVTDDIISTIIDVVEEVSKDWVDLLVNTFQWTVINNLNDNNLNDWGGLWIVR